jgi:hypothetical protein
MRDIGEATNADGSVSVPHLVQLVEELGRYRHGDVNRAQREEIHRLSQDLLEARTRLSELSAWLHNNTRVTPSQEPVQAVIQLLSSLRDTVQTTLSIASRQYQYARAQLESSGWKLPT